MERVGDYDETQTIIGLALCRLRRHPQQTLAAPGLGITTRRTGDRRYVPASRA
jgi:hypothetical protein